MRPASLALLAAVATAPPVPGAAQAGVSPDEARAPQVAAAAAFPEGELVEGVACLADPTQTYTLYLPTAYDPERGWPALLVFDPRGRGTLAAELFRDAAETWGWIVLSSDDTRSDGSWEPNLKALAAMLPELERRWSTDRRRVYAAGFSGGALVALALGKTPGTLAGIIAAGGRLEPGLLPEEVGYAHFGAVGGWDFNFAEMRRLDAELARRGAPHRLEIFDGPHRWMPPELARRAVEWLEVQAMRQGLREPDAEVAARLLAADLTRAREAEGAGDALEALRRYRAAGETFGGLTGLEEGLGEAARAVSQLEGSAAVKAARKEEGRWDTYEQEAGRRLADAVRRLRDPATPVRVSRLAADLRLAGLLRRAEESSYAGRTARRVLETVFVQTSFYLPRELFGAGAPSRAASSLELALEIHPERADLWYNLACARALSGHRAGALEALGEAVERGFRDRDLLETDPDLEPLRGLEGYSEILRRLHGARLEPEPE